MARITSGTVNVPTAGTRVAFPSARTKCVWIRVTAREANTGNVFLGDVTVSATAGQTLYKGTDGVDNSFTISIPQDRGGFDLNSLYLDAATNDDKAEFIAVLE